MGRFVPPWAEAAVAIVRAHTLGRLTNVVKVATFPLVTNTPLRARLWFSCARIAWRGLVDPDPTSLGPFVRTVRMVYGASDHEASREMRRRASRD